MGYPGGPSRRVAVRSAAATNSSPIIRQPNILSKLFYYRRWSRLYHRENDRRVEKLKRLSNMKSQYQGQLEEPQAARLQMAWDIDAMKTRLAEKKQKADASEEEMLDEIIALKAKIEDKEAARRQQLGRIKALQEKLAQV